MKKICNQCPKRLINTLRENLTDGEDITKKMHTMIYRRLGKPSLRMERITKDNHSKTRTRPRFFFTGSTAPLGPGLCFSVS
jgi:hypothetical protein